MKQPLEVYSIFGCDIIEEEVVEVHPEKNEEISVNKSLSMGGIGNEDEGAPPFPTHPEVRESTLPLKDTQVKHNKELEVFLFRDAPKE
ncbi:hypothetical protein AHAS_Ahas06G0193700 [Arachis hypogaea]